MFFFFFFNDTATTEIYTLSLHDALPILYLPNPAGDLRRRFLDGLYLPLVVLGARGLYEDILPRLRSLRARRLIPFSYVSFAAVGSAFLILAPLAVAASPQYSMPAAEYDGLHW